MRISQNTFDDFTVITRIDELLLLVTYTLFKLKPMKQGKNLSTYNVLKVPASS